MCGESNALSLSLLKGIFDFAIDRHFVKRGMGFPACDAFLRHLLKWDLPKVQGETNHARFGNLLNFLKRSVEECCESSEMLHSHDIRRQLQGVVDTITKFVIAAKVKVFELCDVVEQ